MDEQKTTRESKFVALDGAIEGLSRAVGGLGELINEMQNGPTPQDQAVKAREVPAFQIVYDESAIRIMEIRDRILKMTEEIRTRLF